MKDVFSQGAETLAAAGYVDHDREGAEPATSVSKRVFDVAVSFTLIVLLSPVLILIAAAIRLDSPGAVLFRQSRHGLGGETITVLKFRTMRSDLADRDGAVQATQGDARVTRIGRFLRRSCLDELPQLCDVLVGNMSLVGPRPHPIGMEVNGVPFTQLVHGCDRRLRVRPGLTGLAQISGNRGPVHDAEMARERLAYDNEYIDKWNFWQDISILFRTVALPFKKGCY